MNELIPFLISTVAISLSGVMAPGAITAATIAQGTRNKWAGGLISLGHGVVEMPLIFLLMAGLGLVFKMEPVKIGIGIAGGLFLLYLGGGMIQQLFKPQATVETTFNQNSVWTGILLSATNPYFLLWWATVGLNLALGAKELGIMALVLFAIIHWLCDLVWLMILSTAAFYSHKGAGLLSNKLQQGILLFCGACLLVFGQIFLTKALISWGRLS